MTSEQACNLAALAGTYGASRENYGCMRGMFGGNSRQAREALERSEEDRVRFLDALLKVAGLK